MKKYLIELRPAATRDLRKIHSIDMKRISAAIDDLSLNPRPLGCLKMQGNEGFYRLRVGNYRIIYEIQDMKLIVIVIKI